MTCTSPGTATNPCRVICVDHTGTVPPVSADLRTTATISTTGANSITMAGCAYYYGIAFQVGSSTNAANITTTATTTVPNWFDGCKLVLNNTSGSSRITIGGGGTNSYATRLHNTTVTFGAVLQACIIRGKFTWENTPSAIVGTVPTTLFTFSTGFGVNAKFVGVDLSAAGSGKNLFDHAINMQGCNIELMDCKLGTSVTLTTGTITAWGSPTIRFTNCDSADTNYRYARHSYEGFITHEATIVRTGGATNGSTTISRKMVSSANVKFYGPLYSDWVVYFDDTPGSKTITIPVVTDNVTLTDREAWIEVEYLGTSGFPQGSFASDAAADPLATAANQPTDGTSTWTTTGLTTPVKQSLSVNFTTAEAGPYRVRVCLAKASTTMYFDPLIVTGTRQWTFGEGGFVNEGVGSSGGGGVGRTLSSSIIQGLGAV